MLPSQLKGLLDNMKSGTDEISETNYRTAVSIIADNPGIFDEEDKQTFIKSWFKSPKVLEILDSDKSDNLKCGVGSKPGISCKRETCLLDALCVHKDIPVLAEKEAKTTDQKEKKKEVKRVKTSAIDLKMNV